MVDAFQLAFIPVFKASDALGILRFYLKLTSTLDAKTKSMQAAPVS
jgi:hypothetical protein